MLAGKTPTTPAAFDTSDSSLRWWDTGPTDAVVAMVVFFSVIVFFLLYFLPAIVVLARRPERWQLVGLLDLLAGWTVIGWIVAMGLAIGLPRPASNRLWPAAISPDGRWWWDGYAWQPRPPGPPVAGNRFG